MSTTTWTKKAADLLGNLNYYRGSLRFMREMLLDGNDEELRDKLRQTERLVACIDGALQMMTDEDRFFLDRMFVNAGHDTVDDICAECCMEKSNVYRLRKRAIDKFTMAMYGRL